MKHALLILALPFISFSALAKDSPAYACDSASLDGSLAIATITQATSLNLYIQNYRQTDPEDLIVMGTLDVPRSTDTQIVFNHFTDVNNKPTPPSDAQLVRISFSNGEVTSIEVVRTMEEGDSESVVFDQNCQLEDTSS